MRHSRKLNNQTLFNLFVGMMFWGLVFYSVLVTA